MKKLVVRKSVRVKAPVAVVWKTVTSPDAMKQWMLVEPALEGDHPVREGTEIRWKDTDGKVYLAATVVSCEPNRRLVLSLKDASWTRKAHPDEVTYALMLSENEGRTSIELVFGDLAIDPEGEQWYEAYNTDAELEMIKKMAEQAA